MVRIGSLVQVRDNVKGSSRYGCSPFLLPRQDVVTDPYAYEWLKVYGSLFR